MTQHDTDTVTYRPPIKRVIRGLLSDYGPVTDTLLVCMTAAEVNATAETIRETVWELEADGEIYNASGSWKVMRA